MMPSSAKALIAGSGTSVCPESHVFSGKRLARKPNALRSVLVSGKRIRTITTSFHRRTARHRLPYVSTGGPFLNFHRLHVLAPSGALPGVFRQQFLPQPDALRSHLD